MWENKQILKFKLVCEEKEVEKRERLWGLLMEEKQKRLGRKWGKGRR